ncbi:MAG: hypothetical protein MUD17_00215 [Gemmatimonadaceae bacterium]|jgi:hypothetical protein|nr:hypothetical protein [Gemmatimonadaceae bacterium]
MTCPDPVCYSPDRPWSEFVSVGLGTETASDSSAAVFSFPQRTLVRVTVVGRILRIYNPLIPPSWNLAGSDYPSLDADGERIGGDRGGEIYTAFTGTGATNIAAIGPSPNAPFPGLIDSFSVTGVVRGSGPVKRRPFLQPSYPGPPACNGLTGRRCVIGTGGQQAVRVEIVSNGQLTLTATPPEVERGGLVTFTASAGSLALQVHEWIWRSAVGDPPIAMMVDASTRAAPDAATRVPRQRAQAAQTSAVSCHAGQASCTIPVHESGVMWVRATVGSGGSAMVQAASANATAWPVVTCPTGDSLLDLPATRELLKTEMERTETLVPKVEWAGYVYRLPDGSHRFEVDVTAPNICNGSSARVATNLGWTPVLLAHSHPAVPGRPLCNGTAEKGPHKGILSPQDWEAADLNWGRPPVVPVVAIDPNTIAIGRTGAWSDREKIYDSNGIQTGAVRVPSKSQFDAAYSSFRRRVGSCVRP